MKTLVTFGSLLVMATWVCADPPPSTLRAPIQRSIAKPQREAELSKSEPQGVIPRAIRGGNPLQMLNPKAPAQYGTGEQSLAYNPISGKYDQIVLFQIYF